MKPDFDLFACAHNCKTAFVITEPFISQPASPPFEPYHLPLLHALGML